MGTAIGTVLGLIGCGARNYEFPLDADVYYLDTLPVVVQYDTVAVVAVAAVLISSSRPSTPPPWRHAFARSTA